MYANNTLLLRIPSNFHKTVTKYSQNAYTNYCSSLRAPVGCSALVGFIS